MKHVIIGDLHGRDVWQQVNFSNYEKAVFLGADYVDSFKALQMKRSWFNLMNIIKSQRTPARKNQYCWAGVNHDVQYLHYPENTVLPRIFAGHYAKARIDFIYSVPEQIVLSDGYTSGAT